jgi:hypothetical protein
MLLLFATACSRVFAATETLSVHIEHMNFGALANLATPSVTKRQILSMTRTLNERSPTSMFLSES